MAIESTCVCGHLTEGHERTPTSFGACAVEGCPCVLYEWDGDEFDRDGDPE